MNKVSPIVPRLRFDAASEERDIVASAAQLAPALQAQAKQADALCWLPDETIAALDAARLFDMAVPRSYGGLQSSLDTFLDVLIELGRADGSVAWTVGLMSTETWMAATLYPPAIADQVFGRPGEWRAAGTLSARSAKVKRVPGGLLIEEGLWMYTTGVHHAHWVNLGVPLPDDSGQATERGVALIPAAEVSLLEDWDPIGLRGTGSTSVAVKDLFVPDERIALMSRILRDEYAAGYLRDAPIYWMPLVPLFAVRLVCPLIGMGKAALEFFLKNIHTRGVAFTIYQKQSDTAATHLRIGEASAKLDAAESIVRNAFRQLEASASRLETMTNKQRAQIWRDAGFASQLIWEAVDMLALASGTAAVDRNSPMSRIWHDVRVACMHGGLYRDACLENYGRLAAGQSSLTPLLPPEQP
jgi:3-hydroxy-9,10-secoandrosta-1,3,5(10)-triene-9,17-dione monooxygenase